MAQTQYIAQTDLEEAVGGADVLRQLLDKTNAGVADPTWVSDIISQASADADSAVQVIYAGSSIVTPFPPALVYRVKAIAAYYAYEEGTRGQGIPGEVKARYERANEWLEKVVRREVTLAVPSGQAPVASSMAAQQVDRDPGQNQITIDSLVGFR